MSICIRSIPANRKYHIEVEEDKDGKLLFKNFKPIYNTANVMLIELTMILNSKNYTLSDKKTEHEQRIQEIRDVCTRINSTLDKETKNIYFINNKDLALSTRDASQRQTFKITLLFPIISFITTIVPFYCEVLEQVVVHKKPTNENCSICTEVCEGVYVECPRQSQCLHHFHVKCAYTWYKTKKASNMPFKCPTCREYMTDHYRVFST